MNCLYCKRPGRLEPSSYISSSLQFCKVGAALKAGELFHFTNWDSPWTLACMGLKEITVKLRKLKNANVKSV
ncbi:hypothetical protein BBO01nite_17210 [Brevibacillus borstelensis]|nr:hypothetical protein BBO01nite_17210 [Brevibacillus borstelensis]